MKLLNLIICLLLIQVTQASTYTVINTNDTGAGSLRQAMLDANANAGADNIFFAIPGAGPHTIQPLSALPIITEQITIDGSTQPNAICPSNLLIVIDGSSIGVDVSGMILQGASNSVIKGLVFNNFQMNTGTTPYTGIITVPSLSLTFPLTRTLGTSVLQLNNADNCDIECNIFGLDNTGMIVQGNGVAAVAIGVDSSDFNTIGGSNTTQRNIIAAHAAGIILSNTSSNNNVYGNYIGTDITGSNAAPFNYSSATLEMPMGIFVVGGSDNNNIGSGSAGEGNLISGNYGTGISTSGGKGVSIVGAENNSIKGNNIGLDVTGTIVIGQRDASSNPSNNQYEIELYGADNTVIGGVNTGEGNMITGIPYPNYNSSDRGINAFASDNLVIYGNYIGTNAVGSITLGNYNGIDLSYSNSAIIGGASSGMKNVIGTMAATGSSLANTVPTNVEISNCDSTLIQGNHIGINKLGTAELTPPTFVSRITGVNISNTRYTLIGGSNANEGNLIGGYYIAGIMNSNSYYVCVGTFLTINPSSPDSNLTIQGNIIGADITGLDSINTGTLNGACIVLTGVSNLLIGGSSVNARNILVSSVDGIQLRNIYSAEIQNNYIGVDATGNNAIPNHTGILLLDSVTNTNIINNVISGNKEYGITTDRGCLANNIVSEQKSLTIQGNKIGVNAAGTSIIANGLDGIYMREGLLNSKIGGPLASDRNIISGNGRSGIIIGSLFNSYQTTAEFDTIQNNYIGTDITGNIAFPNAGVGIGFQANDNTNFLITDNIISNNTVGGIICENATTSLKNSQILNNKIGTDITGLNNMTNGLGIFLGDNSTNNTIGTAGQKNIIAFNGGDAVSITGAGATSNNIGINSIFCNAGLGINLNGTANINKTAPTVVVTMVCPTGIDTIRGIALPLDTVELYYDDLCAASCQGKDYITTVIADGAGNYEYFTNLTHQFVVATATDAAGNTSEFGCPVDVFTLSNDTTICSGNSVSLTASGSNIATYLWTPGGATTPSITINPNDTTTYGVQGFGGGGCLLVTDSVVVNVIPDISVGLVDTSICNGGSLLLDATTIGVSNYLWNTTATTPTITANTTGQYWVNVTHDAPFNCISSDTMDLIVLAPITDTDVIISCTPITWIDGNNYAVSNNVATFNIVNGSVNGCDSLVSLDLTINNSTTGTDVITSCTPITWLDGNNYSASNNTATFNIVAGAANGCDSLVSLDLTINNSVTRTDVIISCTPITWLDGINYATSNNTATFNIVAGAANGCDSLVNLDLTINSFTTGADVQVACDSYSWLDGNTYTANNNTAIFTLTGGSIAGCDSLVTLSLTINNTTSFTQNPVICDGQSFTVGTSTYTITGNYTDVLTTVNNCDSAVTTNLTVNPSPAVSFFTVDENCNDEQGEIITTLITGTPPITYNWDNGATTPDITGLVEGTYTLIVADNTGCFRTEQVTIDNLNTDCDYHVYLPNAFSPNGDGENDVLYVRGKGIQSINLIVYNRWGNKVFETSSLEQGWDGTYRGQEQNSAVFVYYIEATFINGQSITEKGNVSIVK